MNKLIEHTYQITFIEYASLYDVSQFLNEFEKLCNKHNVQFYHTNVHYLDGRSVQLTLF